MYTKWDIPRLLAPDLDVFNSNLAWNLIHLAPVIIRIDRCKLQNEIYCNLVLGPR